MSSQNPPKPKNSVVKEQTEIYDGFDRYEIIDHIRYDLKPSPTVNHQKLLTLLNVSLYYTCHAEGIILLAPMDVYFDDGNIFQPDLIFISNDNQGIIKEQRIEGAPDLVAEILSPSTSMNDKIRKKAQYERFGVKEYWVVDPVHFVIDQFVLDNGKFTLNATYAEGDTLISDRFPCVGIDMTELFNKIR
jgi:Uma2 family endonuclease